MDNANKPAFPWDSESESAVLQHYGKAFGGLTKCEKACIELGVPDTGDEEIDRIIRKAERKKVAMAAMQGIVGGMRDYNDKLANHIAHDSVVLADALLKELEATE